MDVDPRRLGVLLTVVRCAGVIGAARALHLTPQAISLQIATLEHEVGMSLFDRTHRRMIPTAIGRALAAHAERIEAELVAAARTVAAASGRASGVVRIAAFQSAIRYFVAAAIPALRAEHPGIAAMVLELHGRGVGPALRTGEVDLVVDECDDEPIAPTGRGTVTHLLRRDPYHVIAPSTIARTLRSPGALADQRWIAAPDGTACHAALGRLARRARFEPIVAHVCAEFPSVLALVAAGEGVAIVPELALGDARMAEPCAIAGLGARKLLAIQRSSPRGTEPVVDAVVQVLRQVLRAAAS
jgi:DNA-binding transcriptional LysR family regulator